MERRPRRCDCRVPCYIDREPITMTQNDIGGVCGVEWRCDTCGRHYFEGDWPYQGEHSDPAEGIALIEAIERSCAADELRRIAEEL